MIKDFGHCEYETERRVFEFLARSLPQTTDIVIFPNIELFDPSKHAYLECDAIVVTKSFVAVIDLKEWIGSIVVQEPKWRRGVAIIDSPHIVNNRKCKVLKSYMQHALSGVAESKLPFVQSIIALTSPEASVEGTSSARQVVSEAGTVTLDGVEELAQYLKLRLHHATSSGRVLTDQQFHKLVGQLDLDKQELQTEYADQIAGYRIREDKGSAPSYITYIAERNPNIDNRLYRLRVFGKLSEDLSIREKQLRSLKAASSLPYHPGIKNVQSHPNESNLIVEVSDWTATRSLDDMLAEHERLDWHRAATIVRDLASALAFIHDSAAGLVHRNVQPRSILVGTDGHAQLTDFDLTFDPGAMLTVLGSAFDEHLSAKFVAPEVFLGQADFKSDVYSLGAVFFLALTGQELNDNTDRAPLLSDALDGNACTVPARTALIALVQQMLADSPADRPSAAEVDALIGQLLDGQETKGQPKNDGIKEETAYTSREKISEGATSDVFLVDNHGEFFIQKIYKFGVTRDQALHERDVLRAVDRLNLQILYPRVRHFSEVSGHRWCLATDLVPGRSMRHLLQMGETPSLEQFVNVARVLLEALATLHEPRDDEQAAIIHNDINPNNILIDDASSAVGLIDFGCASPAGVVTLRGTPGYVHPALVSRGEMNACPQGDLFALAKTLWQWLCGSEGFVNSVAEPQAPELTALLGWLEPALATTGCAYGSAADMLAELEQVLAPPIVEVAEQTVEGELGGGGREAAPANPFVRYLNTLHNVSAGNANALAEYQATNHYFSSIYESTPMTGDIYRRLTNGDEVVIVLSGHAGDGKSTVALEVLKQLRGVSPKSALAQPPKPLEVVDFNGKHISILKDMSEHTADSRREKFEDALRAGSGSWLIVSNTGPLLNTLKDLRGEVEERILELLDQPIGDSLHDTTHCISDFEKPIYVANLSKLDNVETAVNVLKKMSFHSSWKDCEQCGSRMTCPIRQNVDAIQNSPELPQRVTWMYRLLTSYERRLTMRQMTAHLAYSITGGTDCAQVPALVDQFGAERAFRQHVFSELFFGFSDRGYSLETTSLYCVEQLRAYIAPGRTRPAVELKLQNEECDAFAPIVAQVKPMAAYLKLKSLDDLHGGKSRASLRRLVFMFGRLKDELWWKNFVEAFSGSEKLQDWEQWRALCELPTSKVARKQLVRQILSVLGEHCTGFTRVPVANDKLYVTLRRDDLETTQPVQVVIGEFDEKEFELIFDQGEKIPRLSYGPANGKVFMRLPLPLLDFVTRRSTGEFGQSLDPIYVNQLDLFCSQLISERHMSPDDIRLLSVGVTGEQKVFSVELDNSNMEIY